MIDHKRHHKVPSNVKVRVTPDDGKGPYTDDILDGMEKIKAIAALVQNVIVWRAQHIAWNVDIYKAEPMLVRLIYREGIEDPKAMDLLARIYFQQSKYEKARDLWNRAAELQPGNPALKRTASAMNSIAKSPTSAITRHKIGVIFQGMLMIALLCMVGLGGKLGVDALIKWAEGPLAVQNLTGRFTYKYDSITKDMVYVPSDVTVATATEEVVPVLPPMSSSENDGKYSLTFTRRKNKGSEIGRIEIVVERIGGTLKASGSIPNLHTRYLVEQALWEVPGVTDIDLRGLVVDRTYRVTRGDSLWMIAKRLYGDGNSWTLLAKANDLRDPSKLKIGQQLDLPLGDEYLEITDERIAD